MGIMVDENGTYYDHKGAEIDVKTFLGGEYRPYKVIESVKNRHSAEESNRNTRQISRNKMSDVLHGLASIVGGETQYGTVGEKIKTVGDELRNEPYHDEPDDTYQGVSIDVLTLTALAHNAHPFAQQRITEHMLDLCESLNPVVRLVAVYSKYTPSSKIAMMQDDWDVEVRQAVNARIAWEEENT